MQQACSLAVDAAIVLSKHHLLPPLTRTDGCQQATDSQDRAQVFVFGVGGPTKEDKHLGLGKNRKETNHHFLR